MNEQDNRLTPVAWQRFGNDWCLTGQFGMRPIFLAVDKRKAELRLLERGLLVPFRPDNPHAMRIVDAWNSFDSAMAILATMVAHIDELKRITKEDHYMLREPEFVAKARALLNP